MTEPEDDFTPRNYQLQLMNIALQENSIIFLPTGTGKTYIALLVLKRLSSDLKLPFSQNGKLSVILVNTVILADQHSKYVRNHAFLNVGCFTGDMNVDFWTRQQWESEFEKYQVLVMTTQIFVNLLQSAFITLDRVNLLILDECHRGVDDHCMRQLMKQFEIAVQRPRVIGLTATLLNGNCKTLDAVIKEVRALEVTFHSKIATVEELKTVIGYATNPREKMIVFESPEMHPEGYKAIAQIKELITIAEAILNTKSKNFSPIKPLHTKLESKVVTNILNDLIYIIEDMGLYGGEKGCLATIIKALRLKCSNDDPKWRLVLDAMVTTAVYIQASFLSIINKYDKGADRILFNSTPKIKAVLNMFVTYPQYSQVDLSAIVFTQRRSTAKTLNHILEDWAKCVEEAAIIKPNFIVGFQSKPGNDTRSPLYIAKKNREVLQAFGNKEINTLVASNILEEGVDMQQCSMVIRYDRPEDYRAYIQSKGRARHKNSLFYLMVQDKDLTKYSEKYKLFQSTESFLNEFLIGKTDSRELPSQQEVNQMYREDPMPPYFTNGPGSARISLHNAISLLCQYCTSLPGNMYTQYSPEWLLEWVEDKMRVLINLPIISPLRDTIVGPTVFSKKLAKRSAAMKACITLHKLGEIDDFLKPKAQNTIPVDVSFLFNHYPEIKEPFAGSEKMKRLHHKQFASCIKKTIEACTTVFMHVIELEPQFARRENVEEATLFDAYTSPLCFAILTAQPLPVLCDYPIFVTLGEIRVNLRRNIPIILNDAELQEIKQFHFLVFNDILNVVQSYLAFDETASSEMMLLVPFNKTTNSIDLEVLQMHHKEIKFNEMTTDQKLELEVTLEGYLKKIVFPWYRQAGAYIVTEVCFNKTPCSPFPNVEFGSFAKYFQDKYSISILNRTQPLVLVKGLSKRLNLCKPRGVQLTKRRHEHQLEELSEYLIPEMLIKHDFPSCLWIQAHFMPTILMRTCFLLQLEELRAKIAREAGLGPQIFKQCLPLELDLSLIKYNFEHKEQMETDQAIIDEPDNVIEVIDLDIHNFNKDFASKVLEAEYPWREIDEPKDIERDLTVNLMDIEYYHQFLSKRVSRSDSMTKNSIATNKNLPAITYDKKFIPKSIKLLQGKPLDQGPELRDFYRAMCSAKANDIVNLERLETLGDSFLKYYVSLYVILRFPDFNEGQLTSLKCRLISNKNLFYLAVKNNLNGILKFHELSPKDQWLPPCFKIPEVLRKRIVEREVSISGLFTFTMSREEQITGRFKSETIQAYSTQCIPFESTDEDALRTVADFLQCEYMADKTVADSVEALLGAYFQACGFDGASKFLQWLDLIPASENIVELFKKTPPDPKVNKNATLQNIRVHLPQWQEVEQLIGYHFKNQAYLLQAFTHSSYVSNRVTLSYERLEFIGDAVLDYLITCHIYESCGSLKPGELTDLRSALVNNNTFATLVVRNGFHKFLLEGNQELQRKIDQFCEFMVNKNFEMDEEVLILLEESDLKLGQYIDVPKTLGDLFESIIGAVFLDSGMDLEVVWNLTYKLMWKEIDTFSTSVPKNAVRRIYEWKDSHPNFGESTVFSDKVSMVPLTFMDQGRRKRVFGFGSNKANAKKAAAKIAIRLLEKSLQKS